MRIYRAIQFDRQEFETLNRVDPSIRIAFSLDQVDRNDNKSWQAWGGRALHLVCSARKERLSAEQVWGAYDALERLIEVLTEQSDREWWIAQLTPEQREGGPVLARKQHTPINRLPVGTDMANVLAEARQVQLREAKEAESLLSLAKTTVGHPREDDAWIEGA